MTLLNAAADVVLVSQRAVQLGHKDITVAENLSQLSEVFSRCGISSGTSSGCLRRLCDVIHLYVPHLNLSQIVFCSHVVVAVRHSPKAVDLKVQVGGVI